MVTAPAPPISKRTMFMIMEVILPAMLLRKLGLPQAMIFWISARENLGRQKRSWSLPLKKGYRAMEAQTIMPLQVARAAPQMPHRKINRKVNSSTPVNTDIKILSHMLIRIFPQIRR